jgi:Leucine-rich repeat (LRR) protein
VSDNQNTPSSPQSIRRLLTLLLEVGLLAVLAFIVVLKWNDIKKAILNADDRGQRQRRVIAEPSGDKAAEQEAAEKLSTFKDKNGSGKYLVISEKIDPEKPEKRVTSINYKEALKLTARLYRISTIIADNSNISDDDLKYFSGLAVLTSLVLTNTGITDAGMANLRPLSNLETLHLSGTKVTDAGLDDIAQLTNLKILNLSQTGVTDAGMKKLVPLTNLEWLLLSETSLSDAGLDELAAMKHLHRLTIGKTKVTAAGVDRLKKAIPALAVDQ